MIFRPLDGTRSQMDKQFDKIKGDEMSKRPLKGDASSSKATYTKPTITRLGKVAQMTAGPSFGQGESGNPFVYKS